METNFKLFEINKFDNGPEHLKMLEGIHEIMSLYWHSVILFIKSELESKDNSKRLNVFLQILSDNCIQKLYQSLDMSLRMQIKEQLEQDSSWEVDLESLQDVLIHLRRAMIVPQESSSVLSSLIDTLDLDDFVDMARVDPKKFAPVFHYLNKNQNTDFYRNLDSDQMKEVVFHAMQVDNDSISRESLIEDVKAFKANKNSSFLIKNITSVIQTIDESKERLLLDVLIKSEKWQQLEHTIQEVPPLEILLDMDKDLLNGFFGEVSTEDKIELLTVYKNHPHYENLYQTLAPKGTKIEELVKMELEVIVKNPSREREILLSQNIIKKKFLSGLRSFVKEKARVQLEKKISTYISALRRQAA